MIKCLITGSCGFIGSNLSRLFPHVMLYDIDQNWDIFDDYLLEDRIEEADVVYHLAALTSVEKSFKNPRETYRVNVLGTAKVVELCNRFKKKLIYPSSASVYIPDSSPYAKSKKIAEDIVVSMMPKNRFTVLRLYNVFGPDMNPNSGSIMYNFLTSKKLVVYGDGEQTRDFIHVRDVVSIMKVAIDKRWESRIVDVGVGQAFSINYVAGLFAHYRKMKIEYQPPRREIKWSISDPTMRLWLYPYPITTNLEEDIKELCLHQ